MFDSKKYVNSINAKGIFDNTYETKIPQTVVSKVILSHFENPDNNGHGTDFGDGNYRYVSGVCNLDRISYKLLEEIKGRQTFDDEDWLGVIASDHGGHSTRHGSQNIQDKTTFLALSKPIEELVK